MDETEWLNCEDPLPLLALVLGRDRDRKLRLLNACTCRRIWNLLPVGCRAATEALELYADGLIEPEDYFAARKTANAEARAADRGSPNTLTYATASVGISNPPTLVSAVSTLDTAATAKACAVAAKGPPSEYDTIYDSSRSREMFEQIRLIRDIVGNPFRPVSFDPEWRTPTVVQLASHIYESRAFDQMPILADALQDADCDNADVLSHCRDPEQVHVRGCWVVDLVLGKS